MILDLTDENFEGEVLKSEIPVLIDFWAEWCGPCKMMTPVMEELEEEYAGKLKIVKLNVDEARETASNYGIMSIPTIILFNQGAEVDRLSGAMPKDSLVHWIESKVNL
ncbi:MAG: thioredoxin [Candidatus Omnitrophica bacterium]|nr:thioredoxin [Candidatus Omnitrophota bacterium]